MIFFFWLKKFLGYWVTPVPVCLALLIVGLLLLRGRRARIGRILMTIATVILFLVSNKAFSQWLVRPLENRYPAIPELTSGQPVPARLARCRYVVVLGGGNGHTPGLPALEELSTSAQARITEAVRLLRVLPDARLVVSGPAEDKHHETHATVLERAAVSLGVDPGRIQRIEHALDTEDESNAVRRVVGGAPFALVTSAWHMPRAAALFRAAGLDPLPCPTDFTAHSDQQFHWHDFLWDAESLERSTVACRERVGYLWIWLRGKAPAAPVQPGD